MTVSIPEFDAGARVSHDDKTVTWGFVFWRDHDDNRYHIAVMRQKADGLWGLRDNAKVAIYKNPPMNADGTYKSRWDDGYFPTRHLNALAKDNWPIVEAALAYVNSAEQPMEADGKVQVQRKIDNQRKADEDHAEATRRRLRAFAQEVGAETHLGQTADILATMLNVEQAIRLSFLIHGFEK